MLYARELALWGIETSIIVPGAFTKGTNHFAHAGVPADKGRLAVGTGVIVSLAFPHGPAAVAVSLVVVILLCELLRLDLGLRSACASLLIVTLSPDPSLLHRGEQRAVAVIVGCGIALLLQLAVYWAWGQRHAAASEESE